MQQYRELVKRILTEGDVRSDRTGTGTIGVFGHQMRFDLREGFPLLTLKKTNFTAIAEELFWFLRGETNISTLNSKIWDEWAYERYAEWFEAQYPNKVPYNLKEFGERIHGATDSFAEDFGDLGPIYGKQWRSWQGGRERETIDQLANVIADLKSNPFSRRHIVSAWNPTDLEFMSLPPCHCLFQFYVRAMDYDERITPVHEYYGVSQTILDGLKIPKYYLSCQLYQRSGDVGIGIPFNIASYALLTELIARECNMIAKDFVHTLGDAHIYLPHVDQMRAMLERDDLPLSQLSFKTGFDFENQSLDTVQVINYQSHPFIKLPIAV